MDIFSSFLQFRHPMLIAHALYVISLPDLILASPCRSSENAITNLNTLFINCPSGSNSLEEVKIRKFAHLFNVVCFHHLLVVEEHPLRIVDASVLEDLANEGDIVAKQVLEKCKRTGLANETYPA